MLAAQEVRFEEARTEVAAQRAAAAENLRRKEQLETQAEEAEASIRQLVVAAASARDEAAAALAEDEQQLRALESERERISSLLRQRAQEARAAAEARRQARAEARERAAAEAREAARDAREAAREAEQSSKPTSKPTSQPTSQPTSKPTSQPALPDRPSPAGSTSPSPLLTPVAGYLTSSYGMRLHPVYKRWSLHDGIDYGAACGTPIRAATSGTVIAVYSHTAYGKRVIIDHGYRRGVGLGTSYNHLSSYSTHVGQRVERGEVIGYVGNTGYSTGCHLHFMVFENGGTVDPMGWL
jgi:murein DD-endopeptidase MepM/ murein hydrolase activator NlpD